MNNKLDPIIAQKRIEVANSYANLSEDKLLTQVMQRDCEKKVLPSFKQALMQSQLAVIAEIKRKSPSKGVLAAIADPVSLAQQYIAGGANALSILTDELFFNGHLNDLTAVATATAQTVPLLRKDFIIDEIQIAQAYLAGASAILCIVAVLGNKTEKLISFAQSLGLDVLVEVHDAEEIAIALNCGAEIIGINNRNLKTFVVETEQAFTLANSIPNHIIKVAESGITEPSLAQAYHRAGFNAVLIGEALVKSQTPADFIRACQHAA